MNKKRGKVFTNKLFKDVAEKIAREYNLKPSWVDYIRKVWQPFLRQPRKRKGK